MIDLHMHSQYSDDGEFAPEELVRQCCECDITVMSVTDHNCARANGEAEQAAQRYGIRYIPGIEIDCTYKGVDFHVLGYGIDWRSEDFASVEENIRHQCIDGSHHQLLKTQEQVDWRSVCGVASAQAGAERPSAFETLSSGRRTVG